jgi:hypothetical protein
MSDCSFKPNLGVAKRQLREHQAMVRPQSPLHNNMDIIHTQTTVSPQSAQVTANTGTNAIILEDKPVATNTEVISSFLQRQATWQSRKQ